MNILHSFTIYRFRLFNTEIKISRNSLVAANTNTNNSRSSISSINRKDTHERAETNAPSSNRVAVEHFEDLANECIPDEPMSLDINEERAATATTTGAPFRMYVSKERVNVDGALTPRTTASEAGNEVESTLNTIVERISETDANAATNVTDKVETEQHETKKLKVSVVNRSTNSVLVKPKTTQGNDILMKLVCFCFLFSSFFSK